MVPAAFSHSIVIRILHYTRLVASFPRQPVSQYQYGKTSLDLDQAGDDGVWGCCGISWTICKQSAPRSRQITTLTPHYSIITGQMLLLTPNQQCQTTEGKECNKCNKNNNDKKEYKHFNPIVSFDFRGFYRAMLCIRGTSHGPVSVSVCHKSEFY